MAEIQEIESYADVLCQHAKKSMFWISLLGIVGLLIISILNASIDFVSAFVYAPTILVMALGLLMYVNASYRLFRQYRLLADAVCVSGIIGATVLVIRAHSIDFPLSTSPLQYAQMICFAICFRKRTVGVVRNSLVTIISLLLVAYYDSQLLSVLYPHYVAGFFAGMMIYIISEDRMFKDYLYRQTVDRERQESSRKYRHLHTELTDKCLPHQIDLILKGLSYKETMPVHRAKFWTSKFILFSPGDLIVAKKQEVFHDFLTKIQDMMRSQYEFKYIPLSRLADGHDIFEVLGPGYIAKSAGDTYTVSYEYPFPLAKNENKGQLVLSTIFKQLAIFKQTVADELGYPDLGLVLSLTYGEGRGSFSGELSNYMIEGETIDFAESYLDARKGIRDLDDKMRNGNHAILIHPRVYRELQRYIPGYLESRVQSYKFEPFVRGDSNNDTIYVMYVDKNECGDRYLEVIDWFRHKRYTA